MRTYCYRNGNVVYEAKFPFGEAPERIEICLGTFAERDWQSELATHSVSVRNGSGHVRRTWPMPPCVASGVHASDGPKLAKFLKDRDCPTQVTNDGDPIYTSAAHRRRALKIRGFVDKNAYS